MTRPIRNALAVALALAAAPAMAQFHGTSDNDSPYSQTVFFGDSLTDSGHYRPALIGAVGPDAAILGKFTTNPWLVWSEYLAEYYDTDADPANQGGTNYAVGGALVDTDAVGALGPTPSMTSQLETYLGQTGGRADPNALYTVWGGNNDLFAVAQGAPAEGIGAAVAAQVGIIGTLQGAGARYVLVPNIPDLGLTPSARAQGPAAQAGLTAIASAYNDALYGALAQNGLRVIPMDMFHLFQELAADPASFGFSNITGTACQPQITAQSVTCQPGSYVSPGAATSHAFADGVHPSGAAHGVIAGYATSVLEGPRQMAVLANSAAMTGRARAERVSSRLQGAQADGRNLWFDLRGDFQRYDHGTLYDGAGPALTLGVDWTRDGLTYGGFLGHGAGKYDWGRRGGEFDQDETTIGGYLGWRSGNAWVNLQAGWTDLAIDTARNANLGQLTRVHRGDVDGSNVSIGLDAGYEFGQGALRHGPVAGVLAQRIEIDGFAETDPGLSTSLAYPDQEFDSLVGTAGWQLRYVANPSITPYARLTIDREFEDHPEEVFASLQSIPGAAPYAVPGVAFDDSYGTATVGVRMQLFGLDANVGASLTAGQADAHHTSAFLTLGRGF